MLVRSLNHEDFSSMGVRQRLRLGSPILLVKRGGVNLLRRLTASRVALRVVHGDVEHQTAGRQGLIFVSVGSAVM
jgi:hypothetical protein